MPGVIYQGYSIHGDESSGSNAAVYVAYYLAAAQDDYTRDMLKNTIILLDPCYNPDGMQRFASWVNSNRSLHMNGDPSQRELNEVWPTGRTNHYWFDLNRDWLLLTHPESRGRINVFHHWKPDVLTDHHEMGSNASFFFQPGIPSRTNPNTPDKNQKLTGEIARYHAAALDKIGSMYYSQESFDDFYYGKGSTYPDANGAIGILFEQASSAGHLINTVHGPLSFEFTIRNQVATSLSTQKAAYNLRKQLLNYKREFFKTALDEAKKNKTKGYVFGQEEDTQKLSAFLDILNHHKIDVYKLKKDVTVNTQQFLKDKSFIVPLNQAQYRLVKTVFEKVTSFKDSLFYDVSAWTLPLAFDIPYGKLDSQFSNKLLGKKINALPERESNLKNSVNAYAYVIDWGQYGTPKFLYQLLRKGYRVKVMHSPLHLETNLGKKVFGRGALLILAPEKKQAKERLVASLNQIAKETKVEIFEIKTGLTEHGVDIGSPSSSNLNLPKVCLLVGDGVNGYEAGEIWHAFDQRFNIPISLVDIKNFNATTLSKYNVLILADGNYGRITEGQIKKINDWLSAGGTLIAQRSAVTWASNKKIISVKSKSVSDKKFPKKYSNYENMTNETGAQVTGGAIVEGVMDLTHPLCYGYYDSQIHLFRRGNYYMEVPKLTISAPVKYADDPLVSGYMSQKNQQTASNSAAVLISAKGKGQVIAFSDNLNFRGYWYGTSKLFMNAVFFASSISTGTMLE
jgi:hypothetical protein